MKEITPNCGKCKQERAEVAGVSFHVTEGCSRQCDAKEQRWQIRIDGIGVTETAAAIKQFGRYWSPLGTWQSNVCGRHDVASRSGQCARADNDHIGSVAGNAFGG